MVMCVDGWEVGRRVVVASFPVLHHSYCRLQYEKLRVIVGVEELIVYTASNDSCGGGLGTRLVI